MALNNATFPFPPTLVRRLLAFLEWWAAELGLAPTSLVIPWNNSFILLIHSSQHSVWYGTVDWMDGWEWKRWMKGWKERSRNRLREGKMAARVWGGRMDGGRVRWVDGWINGWRSEWMLLSSQPPFQWWLLVAHLGWLFCTLVWFKHPLPGLPALCSKRPSLIDEQTWSYNPQCEECLWICGNTTDLQDSHNESGCQNFRGCPGAHDRESLPQRVSPKYVFYFLGVSQALTI